MFFIDLLFWMFLEVVRARLGSKHGIFLFSFIFPIIITLSHIAPPPSVIFNCEIFLTLCKPYLNTQKANLTHAMHRFFRYYLPDPPAIPTKEGGAELDVSGVWTFTTMTPELGINDTGTSGTKLLRTPNPGELEASPMMLALLGSATPKNFPAPPLRKRPHQVPKVRNNGLQIFVITDIFNLHI
jgi:hypothetical protein